MPKYDILVEETYTKEYIVEANSSEEAFRKLHNDFLTGKRKRPDILEASKMCLEFIVPEEQEERRIYEESGFNLELEEKDA